MPGRRGLIVGISVVHVTYIERGAGKAGKFAAGPGLNAGGTAGMSYGWNPVPECSYCVPGRFFICGPDSRLMSMKKTTGTEIQLDIKSTDVKCS